jgi:hypothetical protein
MAKKTISIASRKQKGRKLQQWVCKKISEMLNIPWGPDELIASREMGQGSTDVRLIGKALELCSYSIECKAQESLSIPAWIRQAKENEKEGTDWLLVYKRSREKPIVVMDAEAFFKLCKRTLEKEK